jgi:cell division protein FtsL
MAMDVIGILEREWPVITAAPVIVIGGAVIIAGLAAVGAWKLKGSIDGGEIRELKAQVDTAKAQVNTAEARRQLILEREQAALAAQAKLEREFQEYKALKVAGTSETQLVAIDKIDAVLVELRTANAALSTAIHVPLMQSQKVSLTPTVIRATKSSE